MNNESAKRLLKESAICGVQFLMSLGAILLCGFFLCFFLQPSNRKMQKTAIAVLGCCNIFRRS